MIKKFDVVVIGGGPSGSTAAMQLCKEGFSVCLIEKKAFPREVLCGEFISHEVTNFLNTHNKFDHFLSLKPNEIKHFSFYNADNTKLQTSLGFKGYGLRRSKLDNLLLSFAIQEGTEVYQPSEVTDIIYKNPGYNLRILQKDGSATEIFARVIIAAYGKQNILDRKLNRPFQNFKSGLNGIKYHIPISKTVNINPEEIQIYTADNIYCGINKVDDDTITLCYLDKKVQQVSSKEKLKILYNSNRYFRDIIPDLNCITKENTLYGTGNIYFGIRNIADNGIFFTGDAAEVIAPLAGDGIGMAIESAQLAARVINELLKSGTDIQTASAVYRKEYRNKFRRKLNTAKAVQNILLNNTLRIPAIKLAALFPALLQTVIKHTRS